MLKRFIFSKMMITSFGLIFFCHVSNAQSTGNTNQNNLEVNQINALYNQQRWEEGRKKAEEILQKNPKDSDMRMMVGKYYIHSKEYDKARYELVKSLEYGPSNLESKKMLITVETETARYSSAICYVNELLEVNPYLKDLWRKKIDLYRVSGNQVEADRLLKRIAQIYPDDPELRKDQTYITEQRTAEVRKSGKIDKTIELARKSVEDQPQEQESYFSVIDSYIKAGDYNNALVYSERALNQFPGNEGFISKKLAVLEHQKRYSELLGFLGQEINRGGSANLRNQYNYFLLEAARNAKEGDAGTLYGKIFDASPGNEEAFAYVFNERVGQEQYEEAIDVLNRHRNSVGGSKELDLKELTVYKRMQNQPKVASLTKDLFTKYPDDLDLRESYVTNTLRSAKNSMDEGKTTVAISEWQEVIRYGDHESIKSAQVGIFNAYQSSNRFQEAIVVLDEMLFDDPGNLDLMMKKSDLYNKQGRYDYALSLYEQVLAQASPEDKLRLQNGYSEIIAPWIKQFREEYKLIEAKQLCERWLAVDDHNQDALLAMINISYQLKDHDAMLSYAKKAEELYMDDIPFKIKLAEAMNHKPETLGDSWELLHHQVTLNPFHQPLVNTFSSTTEEYAARLLKNKEHSQALAVIDTALHYNENSKSLKYLKGTAYEGLKQYDSAYYYQRYYDPSLLEFEDFKQHLDYLGQRSFKNTVGISHLRARFGDNDAITTISTAEYSRLHTDGSIYTGRLNYTGRENGKGIQGQFEWTKPWTPEISSRIDLALANKFFLKVAANAAVMYEWKPTWQFEAGAGFRKFFTDESLMNLNLGVMKSIDDFNLSGKISNFMLMENGSSSYLYNLGLKAQYYMNNPRNFVLAVANVGNSPDIDLMDFQILNSFEVLNTMVGAGFGRNISRNISANALGSWYNFQTNLIDGVSIYKNLYNINLQLNVSF